MAVSHSAFSASHAEQALRFVGKSTDAKPGEAGCKYPAPPNASTFYEMDGTNRYWMYDAEDRIWLLQNTGGGPSPSITIDPTLSIPGAAADAKAVGDKMVWKPEDYVEGELLVFDADGNLISSGIDQDNVAKQDGYYAGSGLGAATAENLIDTKNPGVLRKFTEDTTAGDASVSDVGIATIKEIQGNTLKWNQGIGEIEVVPETFGAYEKTVPAGAKASEISGFGGHTEVWNQLAPSVDITLKVGISRSINYPLTAGTRIIAGHKYLVKWTCTEKQTDFDAVLNIYARENNSNKLAIETRIKANGVVIAVSTCAYDGVSDGTTNPTEGNAWLYLALSNTEGNEAHYSDVVISDLTQLFGAGNEPTDTSDPRILGIIAYAEAHPEYDAGSLLSAKVTEVESVGKNLFDASASGHGLQSTSYYNVLGSNHGANGECLVAGDYTLSCAANGNVHFYVKDVVRGIYIVGDFYGTSKTFTVDESSTYAIWFYLENIDQINVHDVQLERGSTATAYTPYVGTLGTLEIPAALRTYLSDKGYGWSAGTKHNSIEYLSTPLTFTDAATGQTVTSNRIYRQQLAGMARNVDDMDNNEEYPGWRNSGLSGIIGTGINAINIGVLCIYGYGKVGGNTVGSVIPTGGLLMMSKQYFGLTQSEWKTQHAGETIDFIIPLATEKLYDISSYLPEDHTLTVEPGGMLTFLQEDNTQLQVPVTLDWTKDTWTKALDSTHKYILMNAGTKTYISGQSSIAIPSGQHKSLIDLSLMFGSGNEPATVAEFEKFFPLDWYAQNGGMVIGYNGTGIKTVGYNAFNLATGKAELLGGHQYEILGAYTSLSYSTGESIVPSSGLFTPTKNGTLTITGGDDTTCVHLTWSGYRNGDYEAYWEQLREIPISTYFPNGMHSIGDVHDSLYPDRAVQKIGYRAYEDGDEDDEGIITDGTNTIYVLDTPVVTQIESPLNFTLRVDDFGTETSLPINDDEPITTPLKAMIAYGMDFAREVVTIRENYIPKAANPVTGDLAAIDSEGKVYDSGIAATEVAKKAGEFTPGNVVKMDANGKLIDGGAPASEILNKVDYSKAQTLTEAQKAIARLNIGAAAAKATPSSWAELGALVEAGLAASVLEVGDQITVERATAVTATITGSGANSPTVELQNFIETIGEAAPAVYIFAYTANGWAYDGKLITLSDYGIAVSGTPVVGQEIHVVESTTQETYDVMAVDGYDTPVEAGKTHAVSLLTHDVISYNEIPFDPAEALYAVDADTWPDGMPAGTYHITLDHGTYDGSTAQDGVYEFTTTQLIPVGGKIRHSAIGLYQSTGYTPEQILNGKFTTYNADFSTLESNIATTLGSGGTSIGTTTASNPTYLVGSHLNFSQRNSHGNNRWDLSSDRKYLKSKAKGAASGAVASWWYATGEFDMPVRSTKPGYLYGLDPAFVKVLGAVKKRTALPIADGYGYTDTEDLVWFASMTEVFPTSTTNPVGQKNNNIAETSFGADGVTLQQNCYPYWEGNTNADHIKYQGTTARFWWLRGPIPSYSSLVRLVFTSGALLNAYNASGVVPGLCITGNPPPPTE